MGLGGYGLRTVHTGLFLGWDGGHHSSGSCLPITAGRGAELPVPRSGMVRLGVLSTQLADVGTIVHLVGGFR